ncbi:MAG: BLUF domain-containing protein [Croceitalea sp.]|nr:BLUF domain-containing protein [Croceitalea sp.]
MMEALKCVLYVSKAKMVFSQTDLDRLAEVSTKNNEELDITGYLFYEKNYFLQYMEGPPKSINNMIHKIALDDRHELICIIEDEDLQIRRFPNWGMKNIGELMLKNSAIETTIIQTMSLFGENQLKLSQSTQTELFKLMDYLSHSV